MSVQALTWVLDFSPAKGGDRLVLISLANHAHRDGSDAHPTVPTIAREAGAMSERTVAYALYSLEHGWEGSGVAICRDGLGPNRAVNWRVLMDEQATTFRGLPRREREALMARSDTANVAGSEGANVAGSAAAHVAPSGVQHAQAEGATRASRVRHPSVNRPITVHPPDPPEGGADTLSIGPRLTPLPAAGRRRDRGEIEQLREAELDAWLAAHPASPELDAEVADLLIAVSTRVGEATAAIWIAPLHAHQVAPGGIALGTKPELEAWTRDRYGEVLCQIAGRDVVVFGCPCAGYDFTQRRDGVAA